MPCAILESCSIVTVNVEPGGTLIGFFARSVSACVLPSWPSMAQPFDGEAGFFKTTSASNACCASSAEALANSICRRPPSDNSTLGIGGAAISRCHVTCR